MVGQIETKTDFFREHPSCSGMDIFRLKMPEDESRVHDPLGAYSSVKSKGQYVSGRGEQPVDQQSGKNYR
jgi:hypothetical protein